MKRQKVHQYVSPIKGYVDVPLTVLAPEDRREGLYRRAAAEEGVPQNSIEKDLFLLLEDGDPEVVTRRYMW